MDDNQAIHADFRKILCADNGIGIGRNGSGALWSARRPAGGRTMKSIPAYQGQEGLALVEKARAEGRPYALAFVDVRMPPGWDGVETTSRIWQVCPDTQIVLCTAYSDYSWDEMMPSSVIADRLVILKKPFDAVEVLQLAAALTEKYRLAQEVQKQDEPDGSQGGAAHQSPAKNQRKPANPNLGTATGRPKPCAKAKSAINCCSGKTRCRCG